MNKREVWSGANELWVVVDKVDGLPALAGAVAPIAEFDREWAEARCGALGRVVKYVPAKPAKAKKKGKAKR